MGIAHGQQIGIRRRGQLLVIWVWPVSYFLYLWVGGGSLVWFGTWELLYTGQNYIIDMLIDLDWIERIKLESEYKYKARK